MARPDPLVGYLSRTIRIRGVLVDVDEDANDNPKISLTIEITEPTTLAGQVYKSTTAFPTIDIATDDVGERVEEGVYTFYDVETYNVIGDPTMWRKTDTTAGPLQPGYVYKFTWCYVVDGQQYTESETRLFDEEGRNLTPAQHYYTFAGLKMLVQQFLGRSPGSDTASSIVNNALIELWTAHPWSFIQADSMNLDLIAGQDYVDLPYDFLRMNAIEATDNLNHTMIKVSRKQLRALREQGTASLSGQVTYYTITHNPTRDLTTIARPRFEFTPTSTANRANVYTMDFDRYPPALSNDTDIAPIPLSMFPLLKQAVRMIAAEDEGKEEAMMERQRFEGMAARFAAMDEKRDATPQLGYIVGSNLQTETDPADWLTPDIDLTTSGVGE
jgi:hypothetical protein